MRTDWQVKPSFRYDTMCLLNTLTGDPFYVSFNQDTYDHFKPLLTPEAETALADLKRIVKEEGQWIISAMLCLYYSAVEGESMADMLHVLDDPAEMHDTLRQTTYYKEEDWQVFLRSRNALRTIFHFLESIDFPAYWQLTILPQMEPDIKTITAYLADFDVAEKLESIIGFTLPTPTITVYVLKYTSPHGIKVIGQNFITAAAWPGVIALRTAIHEMLHPPYNVHTDHELLEAIKTLEQDAFVKEKFANHNPDYGYNEFVGYVEENCVRTLDQIVSEAYGIARDPHQRWREDDEGMHVFAAALYFTLKQDQFTGSFRDWLFNALHTSLAPGKIQAVYDAFYASKE